MFYLNGRPFEYVFNGIVRPCSDTEGDNDPFTAPNYLKPYVTDVNKRRVFPDLPFDYPIQYLYDTGRHGIEKISNWIKYGLNRGRSDRMLSFLLVVPTVTKFNQFTAGFVGLYNHSKGKWCNPNSRKEKSLYDVPVYFRTNGKTPLDFHTRYKDDQVEYIHFGYVHIYIPDSFYKPEAKISDLIRDIDQYPLVSDIISSIPNWPFAKGK